MTDPTISLIIPAYNEERYIGACLEAAEKCGDALSEIIVVDNASTDSTREAALKFARVRVVAETRKGITRARQSGFMHAKGDILAFVDADTRIPEGWAEKIKAEFAKDPDLACISGPYVYYDLSTLKRLFVKAYWYLLGMPSYWLTGYMVVGGNFAIRKDVLQKMGGFDTDIEFYGEDTNTARRAHEFGKVKFTLGLPMYTSGRRLDGQGIGKTAFLYMKNFLSEVLFKRPATEEYTDIR